MCRSTACSHKFSLVSSTVYRMGGTVGVRSIHLNAPDSILFDKTPHQHVVGDVPTMKPVPLYNTRCHHYHGVGICNNPRCQFLHDEPILDAVFHNGQEIVRMRTSPAPSVNPLFSKPATPPSDDAAAVHIEPGPLVRAKIYMGNVPPTCDAAFIRSKIECFGEVVGIDFNKSALRNGHRSAFVYMKSKAQAEAAIDEICQTQFNGHRLYAKLEACKPIKQSIPKQASNDKVVDDDGFTVTATRTRARVSDPSVVIAAPTRAVAGFGALLFADEEEDDEENGEEEEDSDEESDSEEEDEEDEEDDEEEDEEDEEDEEIVEAAKTLEIEPSMEEETPPLVPLVVPTTVSPTSVCSTLWANTTALRKSLVESNWRINEKKQDGRAAPSRLAPSKGPLKVPLEEFEEEDPFEDDDYVLDNEEEICGPSRIAATDDDGYASC